jgi:hypothetical protein
MPNKVVLKLLSERAESKDLDDSLRNAFLEIPENLEKEIITIFNNVTDMYGTLKIILKGKHRKKFDDFNVVLVNYIATGKVTYFEAVTQLLEKIIPNKVVLKLLIERIESKDLPDSLIEAFLSIPEKISAKNPEEEITTVFNNVARMHGAMKNILQGKYSGKINSLNPLLVQYIETREVEHFNLSGELFRVLEKGIVIAEEEKRKEDQQLLQAEKLRQKALEAEQELKRGLANLGEEYAALPDPMEDSDKELYEKYVVERNLDAARKLLVRVQSLMTRRRSLIQGMEPLEMFLKSNNLDNEKLIVELTKGSYNGPLDAAGELADALWERKRNWSENSINKFSGVKEEYSKLFTSQAVALEEINFNDALKSNNPADMENFFNRISIKIRGEIELRKALSLEIKILEDLESQIKSVDFTHILKEIFTLREKVKNLLEVPELKEDKGLTGLASKISILESAVEKVKEKTSDIVIISDPKIQLTSLLTDIQEEKESHIENLADLSSELKQNVDRAVSVLSTQFSDKKKVVELALNECMETVEKQKLKVLQTFHTTNDQDKHKQVEEKNEKIRGKIVTSRETVRKIVLDEKESPKSISNKITSIDQEQGKIALYTRKIADNEAALDESSEVYLKTQLCFKTIEQILSVLIAETEERINAYQGKFIKKTTLKKEQAGLMQGTMNVLLGHVKEGNIYTLGEKVKELQENKKKFSDIASKVSFWAFLPGTHCLSYTTNDQSYNSNLDAGIDKIEKLANEVCELHKPSLKAG